MQEEHSDLLGLLAQQEAELGHFRKVIYDKLGDLEASQIEAEAHDYVVGLYGYYTDIHNNE